MSNQAQISGDIKIRNTQGPLVANAGVVDALNGTASQYVRGDGTLADFPTSSGGGSSVSYYLNGSVSQGTLGGVDYKELSKVPIIGTGTNFSASVNGYVASFITDVNDPDLTSIPGGNFNIEFYFSASSAGGTPGFYIDLFKYDGVTFTPIASGSTNVKLINQGTVVAGYFSTLAVPTTSLTATDRIAIRVYVNTDGKTITLYTEDNRLGQVITTFSNGLTSLNNLTDQVQFFATGLTGTNFNISSVDNTHTFNLPTASSTARGALSSSDWSLFNNKVPYTGATGNMDFGEYGIKAGWLGLDTTPTSTPITEGTMSWNNTDGTMDLMLKGGLVTLQVGQEEVSMVYNDSGSILSSGDIVYVKGAVGNRVSVGLASNTSEAESTATFGMVTQTIAIGAEGFVTTFGRVRDLDTLGFTAGDVVYLGSTPGSITNIKPIQPSNLVTIGYVERIDALLGAVFVKIQNGYELEELHDVLVTSVANNQGIFWDTATSLWKNKSIATALGYTPISLTSLSASSPLAYNNTTGAFSIQVANSLQNGYLSSSDWTTFNSKVGGTGTSGQVAYWNGTSTQTGSNNLFWDSANNRLGIGTTTPSTSFDLGSATGTAGTINKIALYATIYGSYGFGISPNQLDYISSNSHVFYNNNPTLVELFKIDSVGNLTSVSLVGTGTRMLVTNSAGVISTQSIPTIPVTSVFGRTGAVIAASGDYNTSQVTELTNLYFTDARARTAISLTTTGSSGAASYSNLTGVLNIPIYDSMVYPLAGIAVSTGTAWGTSLVDNSSNWNTAYSLRITSATAPLSIAANVISIAQATTSTSGYLSSTDWNTFNSKMQGGGLTAGKVPFATGSASLGDTNLNYNGGFFGFGTAASTYRIDVSGDINVTGNYYVNGVPIGGGGSISLAAIGSTPNANAATLTGSVLNLEPASDSFGGVVTTGGQTFGGDKTFNGQITSNGTYITNNTDGGAILFKTATISYALLTNTFLIQGTGSKTDFNTYVYGANPFAVWTNNIKRFTISGAGLVGINTTTIGSQFQVFGNAAIGYSASYAVPMSLGLAVYAGATIGFTTNVTTSPANGLAVSGDTSLTGFVTTTSADKSVNIINDGAISGTRGLNIYQNNDGVQAASAAFYKSRGTYASPTNVVSGDLIAAFGFKPRIGAVYPVDQSLFGACMTSTTGVSQFFITGTTAGNYAPSFLIAHTGNVSIGNLGGSIITTLTLPASKLQVVGNVAIGYTVATLAPASGLAVSGNAGFGTSSPESVTNFNTIQVNGTDGAMLRTGTSAYGGYVSTIPTADVMVISNVRNPINGTFSNTGKAASVISLWGLLNNGYLTFSTSPTNNTTPIERMRITSTGNVGIGNTGSATYALDVTGTTNTSNVFRSTNGFMNSYESYNAWELGKQFATTGLTVLTTQYVSVRINGTVYKLALVQEPTPP